MSICHYSLANVVTNDVMCQFFPGCARTLDRNLLRSTQTHTPPPHHTTPPLSSPLSLLSTLPHFHSYQRKQQTPFDTKSFASLHDDRLRSKIDKIQLMIGKNIMHMVITLYRSTTEGNQTTTVILVSQRLVKTPPIGRNTVYILFFFVF